MKISKKYIKLVLLLVLLIGLSPSISFAQVVYKGVNSATAKGTALGKEVNDNSNSGTVINKTDDTPTPITFPMIGLAKTVAAPIIQSNGTYNVTYTLRIQNYSTIALNNIQITDDLTAIFADDANNAAFTMVGVVTKLASNATNGTGAIVVNTLFDGSTDKNLLVAATSSLTSTASADDYFATIRFTINVDTKGRELAYKTYNNTATVTAKTPITIDDPAGVTVTDVSHNNASPNQGDNTKTPLFYNTPTPITLSVADIQVTKTASNTTPDVNSNITFTIKVRNNGAGDAAPVVLNDLLPAGFQYVSKTVSQGTYDQVTGVWSVGILLVGAGNEQTLTVTVKVLPNKTVAEYTNIASTNHPFDPVPANNTSQVIITPKKIADLKITNTDGKTNYVPGTSNTYTIVVTNDGPSDVIGATIANTLPAGFTGTWTAVYAGGATGTANGTGSISELVNMPTGATVTYTYVVDVPSNYTVDPYDNTATVTAPAGVTDPTPANNTATDSDIKDSRADFTITKDDSKTAYVPGTSNTYTIVVTNTGPSNVTAATVKDALPVGFTGTLKAVYTGGATGTATGTATAFATPATAIDETVNMPTGSTITYTLVVNIPSSYTGNYVNTATVKAPTGVKNGVGVDAASVSATDTDTQDSRADFTITKTDGKLLYVPGTSNTYTIVVTNTGPSNVTGATVKDALPVGFTGTLKAVYTGSATGTATGVATAFATPATAIDEVVNMPSGSTITYTLVVNVPSSYTGNYVNTATVKAPTGVKNAAGDDAASVSATDTDTQDSRADFTITKDDGKTAYVPGTSNTYTIVVTNTGPSNVTGATVKDALPVGFTGTLKAVYTGGATGTATGTATAFATPATAIDETVNMPTGSTITYTLVVNVPSSYTGNYVNTATVKAPTGVKNALGTDAASVSATDTDTQDSRADFTITKDDGKTAYVPGTSNTYTIVVTNTGPSNVTGATVKDALPVGFTGTLKAVYTGGATGTATGTATAFATPATAIDETVNMPTGSTITYTLVVNVPSSYTGNYVNTATVKAPTGVKNALGTDAASVSATDTDTQDSRADFTITKTDGKLKYTPGTSNTYTIVVTNTGPSDVTGATVKDALPAGFTGTLSAVYTGSATGTATGVATAFATPATAIDEVVNMPSGSTITYTLLVNVPSSYTGNYVNTATVKAPTGVKNAANVDAASTSATDTDTQESKADLKITKTDNKTIYVPGTTNTYTIVVTNTGPSDVIGATVEDVLPINSTGLISKVYSGGASTTLSTSTVSQLKEIVNMPSASTITYTYVVNVPSDQLGTYSNTAKITIPIGVIETDLTNNSATDSDVQTSEIDLSITKTDGKNIYTPGESNTYTIVVNNNGPSDVLDAKIEDKLPAGFTGNLSAVYTGGASGKITNVSVASTGINEFVNMPINSTITYTFVVNVPSNFTGNFVNKVTITSPEGITDTDLSNNEATDIDTQDSKADLEIIKVASNSRPSFNTNVEFTLTATNKGPSDATGVIVTDLLKAGFTFVSATPSVGSYNNGTGKWTIGNLAFNNTATLKIIALVKLTGPYDNTAVITGNEKDPILPNNTSTVVLIPQDTPSANDDQVKTCDASPVVIDILANDVKSNFDIDPKTVVVTKQPTNGTVSINSITGKATYTPNPGYAGNDQFSYTVKDTNGGVSTEAQVKITVNLPIVAINDNITTDPNSPVIINVLANDLVGSSAIVPGSIVITQQPTNGIVTIDATGKVTYTPNNNYVGTDSFKYTVKDVNGCTSNVATVDIKMNDLPKIGLAKSAMSVTKQQNGSYNITYHFVVGNYGTAKLNNVSIKDDLRNTFKGDQFSVISITSLGTLKVNNQYNGSTDIEMLASGNSLAVGEKQHIEMVVNIVLGADKTTYINTATAEGTSLTGIKTTDISTDGLNPDKNGDVTPSVPTPVDLTRPKEFIPEGFSPNRDGMNDTFVISNMGNKRVTLEIFNRWGNLVYKKADYKNDWSGESNQGIRVGSDLPEGTYFYIIILDGKDKYVGSITLKR